MERAQIVLGWLAEHRPEAIAQEVGCNVTTVYYQLHQFNARGLGFLEAMPRSGRSVHYDEQQPGQIVRTAKTKPEQLKQDFGHWTLNRLAEYVNTVLAIPISRSHLAEVLSQEGLKGSQEKTYFSESPDPQFVEKRGDCELVSITTTQHTYPVWG